MEILYLLILINMETKKEYRLTAWQFNCFDWWSEDNVDYISSEFWKDILMVQNKYSTEYHNIFKGSKIVTNNLFTNIYWIDVYITDLDPNEPEYEVNNYEDEGKREEQIMEWIKNHTITITARWYSQWDYEEYYILVRDVKKKKEIEKNLAFLEEIFTIVETRLFLECRETIEINWKELTTEWEEIDAISTTEEFPDLENLRNGLSEYEIASELELPDENNIKFYY